MHITIINTSRQYRAYFTKIIQPWHIIEAKSTFASRQLLKDHLQHDLLWHEPQEVPCTINTQSMAKSQKHSHHLFFRHQVIHRRPSLHIVPRRLSPSTQHPALNSKHHLPKPKNVDTIRTFPAPPHPPPSIRVSASSISSTLHGTSQHTPHQSPGTRNGKKHSYIVSSL